jgi:hypothetical protein
VPPFLGSYAGESIIALAYPIQLFMQKIPVALDPTVTTLGARPGEKSRVLGMFSMIGFWLGLGTVTHAVSTERHAAGAGGTRDGIPVLGRGRTTVHASRGRTFESSVTHARGVWNCKKHYIDGDARPAPLPLDLLLMLESNLSNTMLRFVVEILFTQVEL